MLQQTVIRVRGEYPAHLPAPHDAELIPPGCTIYHGPNHLWGTYVDGMGRAWPDTPTLLGAFYAAVAPDDPLAAEWRAVNLANGGVVIEYVNDDEVRRVVTAHWAEKLTPDELATFIGNATQDFFWELYVGAGLHYRREPVPA